MPQLATLHQGLAALAESPGLPVPGELVDELTAAGRILENLPPELRPRDRDGLSGGLVCLPETDYTVVVSDLHARRGYLLAALSGRLRGKRSVLEDLAEGKAAVVCVGDAFHAEARAAQRWAAAFGEYQQGFRRHAAMDEEMVENLRSLQMICRLKQAFPGHFHFLKGNHENVGNEEGHGNHPFGKYAREGAMVKDWLLRFAGEELYQTIYKYEKVLPLMAAGDDFLVCHAEPRRALDPDTVINAYFDPQVILDLTWVGNDEAEAESVPRTLESFFPGKPWTRIFGGHRPVSGFHSLRQSGRYVQFNRHDAWLVAVVDQIRNFNPDRDIISLGPVAAAPASE